MNPRRSRPTAQQLRESLVNRLGWAGAQELIEREARAARVSPNSNAAVLHAAATYQQNANTQPLMPVDTREELFS